MGFVEAISAVATALSRTGITINPAAIDGIIVKQLKASNTLDDGRTTNQTHIAITGEQMDMFPYIRSDGYFVRDDAAMKKYFIMQIPVKIYEKNYNYLLNGEPSSVCFNKGVCATYTSIIRNKRANQADQIQVSLLDVDGTDFIALRRLLHEDSFLIMLKEKGTFQYHAYGVKYADSDGLEDLNNHFYKMPTNTVVQVGATTSQHFDNADRLAGGNNTLLYGVPGAGKSWTIQHEYCNDESHVQRLVFHPDYTYSDFVGQILPKVSEDQVTYEFTPGPFTKLLKRAYYHPMEEFFLVIEEINRGNAPAIFGEVFQLLDRKDEQSDADDGFPVGTSEYGITNADIAQEVYGDLDHKVRIPSNMSIIATMNTSDQNVFTLDTAFQRRWDMRLIENSFDHVDPQFKNHPILDTTVTWEVFCDQINHIILEKNVRMTSSEDKRLGTYFVKLRDLMFDNTPVTDQTTEIEKAKIKRNNSRFPEKVIKYLWDDAFKFSREDIFEVGQYHSLEAVIKKFMSEKGNARLGIFKQDVYDALVSPEDDGGSVWGEDNGQNNG